MGLEWYDYLLLIALGIVSVLMILIVVIQPSKDDASRAFSGEKSDLFANQKQRGLEKVINTTTTVLSIAFICLAVLVKLLGL
jgi:preprotein translocase subunit SecG